MITVDWRVGVKILMNLIIDEECISNLTFQSMYEFRLFLCDVGFGAV